jgi:hypothetical protein
MLKDKVQMLQNRAARVITGDNYDIRSSDIFNKLGWNNLQDRRNSQTMNYVTKAVLKKCPEGINEMFHVISNDNFNLRSNDLVLGLSKPNTNAMRRSFSHMRPPNSGIRKIKLRDRSLFMEGGRGIFSFLNF